MHQTTVTNHKNCTHYCARIKNYKGFGLDFSIFGNPFVGDRAEVIEKYKTHFYQKLITDENFRIKFTELVHYNENNDVRLGCFCAPKSCHCDIIKEAIIRTIQLKNDKSLMSF